MSIVPGGAPGGQPGGAPAVPPSLMGGAPRPAIPSSLQASDKTGGVTMPSPHMGSAAGAMVAVRNAVDMLQKSLSSIPMGTPMHSDVLKAIVLISKHLQPDDKNQGAQLGGLVQQIKSQAQQGPQSAIARLFPQQPQAPVMPPPDGGAGAEAA